MRTVARFSSALLVAAALFLLWMQRDQGAVFDRGDDTVSVESVFTTLPTHPAEQPQSENMESAVAPDGEYAAAAALLTAIAPASVEHFPGKTATLLELFKGDIGMLDVQGIAEHDSSSLETLLKSLAPLTGATNDLQLEIRRVRRNNDLYSVDFRQVIDGIPVDRLQRVSFDGGGVVSRLSSTLVHPGFARNDIQVLAEEAAAHAVTALANELGSSDFTGSFGTSGSAPELLYKFVDHNREPDIVWEFLMETHRAPTYRVTVIARTGEAHAYQNAFYWNVRAGFFLQRAGIRQSDT